MAVLDFYGMFDFAIDDDDTYKYTSAEFSELIAGITGTGVSANTLNSFTTTASGLTLTVGSGVCFIKGRFGANHSSKTITLTSAGSLKRYDYLVLEMNVSSRTIEMKKVQGTAAASPAAPTLTQTDTVYQMPLYLCLVNGSTVTLTDARPMTYAAAQVQAELNNRALLNHNHDTVYYTKTFLDTALAGKAPATQKVTSGTSITLADNTEYRLTNVSNLTVTYPSGNFEAWLKITTAASGTITITLPSSSYIGGAPDITQNGVTFELSIKDGVIVGAEVGDGN